MCKICERYEKSIQQRLHPLLFDGVSWGYLHPVFFILDNLHMSVTSEARRMLDNADYHNVTVVPLFA